MRNGLTVDDGRIETNHPTELSGRWLSFDWADKCFGIVMLVVILLAQSFFGKIGLFAAALATLGLLVRGPYGRNYYVFGQWWYSFIWIGLVQRNVLWTANAGTSRFEHLVRRASPLSLDLHILGDPDDTTEDIGLLYNEAAQTDSIVIFADGSDHASVDDAAQYGRLQQLSETIKRLASVPGLNVGISYVFRRRPADVEAVRDWDARNGHPDVLLPEALDKNPEDYSDRDKRMLFLLKGLSESWEMIAQSTAKVDMAVVLTITHSGMLEAAGKGLKSGRDIPRLPIVRLAQSATVGLERANVRGAEVASPARLEAYLRRSWDVVTIGAFDTMVSERDSDEIDLTEAVRHWPHSPDSRITVADDHCSIDGTLHGVVRISGASPDPLPMWYRQLFGANVRYLSIALVGETLSYRGEYWFLQKLIPLRAEFLQGIFGMDDRGPRAAEAQESLEQRREDIYRSRYLQNYVVLVAVSADDSEQFEDDMAEVLRVAESIGLSASRVKGKVRQVPYLLSATTGVPVKL